MAEWCDSVYREDSGRRVLRGGSFNDLARSARSASRLSSQPDDRYNYNGFRVARTYN